MNSLRIFLVDDHAVLREGLRLLIEAQTDMTVVGQAGDGVTAVQQVPTLRPDVVVMDVSLPQMDGGGATERIKQSWPEARVLALTRHQDGAHLRRLLQAGAAGYALKRMAADELIGAIRQVARGETYLDPSLMERMMENYAGRATPTGNATLLLRELSEREGQVLRRVAWGESNKEIAANLDISVKTVEYHKARAMEKLHLRSRTEVVRYALLQGWLHAENTIE